MTPLPDKGSIALVCYLPEPLNSTLREMSGALSSAYSALPHITVLPPRPLLSPVEQVVSHITGILARHSAFIIELTSLASFAATNVLYVEVANGSNELRALYSALNTGDLTHSERYEFTPHVTVGGPFEADALPELMRTANALWTVREVVPRFELAELVLLWVPPGGTEWEPLGSFILRNPGQDVLATAANQT